MCDHLHYLENKDPLNTHALEGIKTISPLLMEIYKQEFEANQEFKEKFAEELYIFNDEFKYRDYKDIVECREITDI